MREARRYRALVEANKPGIIGASGQRLETLMTEDPDELVSLGYRARREGRMDEAIAFYGEAGRLLEFTPDGELRRAHAIRHAADMLFERGDVERARHTYEETMRIYRAHLDANHLMLRIRCAASLSWRSDSVEVHPRATCGKKRSACTRRWALRLAHKNPHAT
jgi:tetratricopeptide (TPR) repeat protein